MASQCIFTAKSCGPSP